MGAPLSYRLNHLDTIAERVTELEPVKTRNRDARDAVNPFRFQPSSPCLQISNGIGDVGFRSGAVDAVLCADVDALVTEFEPKSTAPLQRRGLFHLF